MEASVWSAASCIAAGSVAETESFQEPGMSFRVYPMPEINGGDPAFGAGLFIEAARADFSIAVLLEIVAGRPVIRKS